jgi:uncharacterized protein (UPF0212 family)
MFKVKCKNCGEKIDFGTKICPYCGTKSKKPIVAIAIGVIIVLALLVGVLGSDSDDEKATEDVATEVVEQVQDEQKISQEHIQEEVTDEITNDAEELPTQDSTDFRAWVDSYEEFMNEYVDFMKTYDQSDTAALLQYGQLMAKYADFAEQTDNLNEEDYSTEDWAYYMQAQARVLQRLSEIQ